MPTPRELALQAAQAPGAYVPQSLKEAEQEFERLMRSGLSEDEAFASIEARVDPPAGPTFTSQLGSNLYDMGAGALEAVKSFNGARAIYDPKGIAESYMGVASGMKDTLTRGMQKAREAEGFWETAGRTLAIPLDMAGLPVSRAADSIVAGNTGAGMADALTAVGGALSANNPAGAGRVAGKVAGKVTPTRLQKPLLGAAGQARTAIDARFGTPKPPPPLPGALAQLDALVQAPGLAKATRKYNALAEQTSADAARLLAEKLAARDAAAAGAFGSELLPPRLNAAAQTFAREVAPEPAAVTQAKAATRARIGQQRVADVDRTVAQADAVRAREQQLAALNERLTRGDAAGIDRLRRNLGTAQDTRLGTQVARADGVRRGAGATLDTLGLTREQALRDLKRSLDMREAAASHYAAPRQAADIERGLQIRLAEHAQSEVARLQQAVAEAGSLLHVDPNSALRRGGRVTSNSFAPPGWRAASLASTQRALAEAEARLAAIQAQAAGLPLSILPLP
jgi:hypothetical protein